MPTHDTGDLRRIQATFKNISGTDTDPTTVTFKLRDPNGTVTTYLYGTDAELVKSATGIYYVDYTILYDGQHFYRFEGTGTVISAEEGDFMVRPTKI